MSAPAPTENSSVTSATVTPSPTPTSTGTPTGSPTSSSSRAPQVHTVKAGSGGFKFEPAELKNVSVGDTVTFEFYPPDHSVARAEFGSACVPYENTGKDKVGFWSETQWVDSISELTYFNITINSTEPIFYYCAAPKSCIEKKMIGVINPNATQTLDKQIIAAGEADYQLAPGEEIPKEASSTLTLPGSATSSPTTIPPATAKHGVHLSGGAIAGIVVGAIAFLALCAALFFYVGRTKSLKEMIHRRDATVTKTTPDPNQPGHPGSPGFPPSPFSPTHSHAEFGGNLPPYGQHNATDTYPSGWTSPTMHPGHLNGQPPMTDIKQGHQSGYSQPNGPVEMASPIPGQQTFTAELEAPHKSQ